MPTLPKDLRSKLEKAIISARDEATSGAHAALIALGVGDAKKPSHLDSTSEVLRRRLRARGRQAGDCLKPDDSQEIEHLVQECAYEHWHRMLFARFLIQNELLLLPGTTLDVDFEHCEEEAKSHGIDPWEVAASYGQHMLPEVFRQDDPVLQLRLPTETRTRLTSILNELPAVTFTADDSLGWTYQFWQTKRKKEVNESGVRISADEISPVTQLFTEDYMVEFLLHNTLGAWWAGKIGPIKAASEEEAREKASLPESDGIGIRWTYLRFIQDEQTQTWLPAAGTFDGWPKQAKDITFLDPCMGSGHFPVFALPILSRLRMEEEMLNATEAVQAVLRDNIHGLELDPRCCQIGAFNLALTAWKLAGYQLLPSLHIACCGIAPQAKLSDWVALAGDDKKIQFGMRALHQLFEQAPLFGSLINPRLVAGAGFSYDFKELQPLLAKALDGELKNDSAHEMAVAARGLAKAAEMLAGKYTLIGTNVPFKETKQLDEILQEFIQDKFTEGSVNLATAFVLRIHQILAKGGTAAMVTPHEWLFLKSYASTREFLLNSSEWNSLADLGEHAFESQQAAGAFVALITFSSHDHQDNHRYAGLDVTKSRNPADKAAAILADIPKLIPQLDQLKNPDARIGMSEASDLPLLSAYAGSYVGLQNGDTPHFVGVFWELPEMNPRWEFFELPCDSPKHFGGREGILLWEKGVGELANSPLAYIKGREAWKKQGVAIRQTRTLPATRYTGDLYDQSSAAIVPYDVANLPAIWAYCESKQFHDDVRKIDKKKNVTNATLVKVPFDLAHWQQVAAKKYPHGLPAPYSADPTQWLFNGHPKDSEQPLHVAVARMLGYRWPRQTGSSFHDCPALGPDGLENLADEDGIACLTSVRGEDNAADQLRELLSSALGVYDEKNLLASAGKKGSKSKTLEDWLRDEFFEQHCDLFQNRPFLWHLWDGRKDGFHAIVNYHKLAAPNGAGRRTLEALAHGYLGDWITRQRAAVAQCESGADDRLAAALELHGLLEKILAGEPPYDIFVRWKPLHQQAIGWEPDINDGVRLNARPFLATDLSRGKKGAGIFRCKPKGIEWSNDRGNEPPKDMEQFPWFWKSGKSVSDRVNNVHLKLAVKEEARRKMKS